MNFKIMKFDIIIQCRFGSKRFRGKILYDFENGSFLDYLCENLKKNLKINSIILATPNDNFTKIFGQIAKKNNVKHFFSKNIKENDLLKRYYLCAQKFKSENIIRITSDCPFINPEIIKKMMAHYKKNKLKFLTNNRPRYVPHGFDCEIIDKNLLKQTYLKAKSKFEKEHVTPWIYKNFFNKKNNLKIVEKNLSKFRLTIDYEKDYINFKRNAVSLKKISLNKNFEKYLIKELSE